MSSNKIQCVFCDEESFVTWAGGEPVAQCTVCGTNYCTACRKDLQALAGKSKEEQDNCPHCGAPRTEAELSREDYWASLPSMPYRLKEPIDELLVTGHTYYEVGQGEITHYESPYSGRKD